MYSSRCYCASQTVKTPDGGIAGLYDRAFLPLTPPVRGVAPSAHSTAFFPGPEPSLANSTGLLQLYATDIIQQPSGFPFGWVFGTFQNQPLQYKASYGEASLSGNLFFQFNDATPFAGTCAVAMHRTAPFGYQPNRQ